jgi:hypothetical protein
MIENVANNQLYSGSSGKELLINSNPNNNNSNAPQAPVPQIQEPLIQETPLELSNNLGENQNQNELELAQNNQEQKQNEIPEKPQMVSVPNLRFNNNNNAEDFLTKKQIIIRIIFIILLVLYLIYDIINQAVIKGKIDISIADDALLFILGIIIFICLLRQKRSEHILILTLGFINCVLGIALKMYGMLDFKVKISAHDIILFVIRIIILVFIFIITTPEAWCKRCSLGCKVIWNSNSNGYGYGYGYGSHHLYNYGSSNNNQGFGNRANKRFGHNHNHGFGRSHGRGFGRHGGFGRSHGHGRR